MQQSRDRLKDLMMHRVASAVDGWDAALVTPGMYVGSLSSALSHDSLKRHRVTRVLTVAGGLGVVLPVDIKHKTINITDHPMSNIFEILEESFRFIDDCLLPCKADTQEASEVLVGDAICQSSQAILIHCASGVSRSVSVCCAWLMTRQHMSFSDALQLIRINRPRADPNLGFKAQLTILEEVNGDYVAGQELYNMRLCGTNIVDILITQREAANLLHAKVDQIEEQIQMNSINFSSYLNELYLCQLECDRVADIISAGAMSDGPATIIRKSASSKVSRLIDHLEAQREQGPP